MTAYVQYLPLSSHPLTAERTPQPLQLCPVAGETDLWEVREGGKGGREGGRKGGREEDFSE